MKRIIYYILVLDLFLLGCMKRTIEKQQIEEIVLYPDVLTDQFSDSVFFSGQINYLSVNKDLVVASDQQNGTVFIFDHELNPRAAIGRKGRGLMDFINPRWTFFMDGKLIIFDHDGAKYVSVNLDDFAIKEIVKYSPTIMSLGKSIMMKDGDVMVANVDGEAPIRVLSTNGNSLLEFGHFFPSDNYRHKRAINNFHLLKSYDENVYSVGMNRPFVFKYNSAGEFLYDKDLTDYFTYLIESNEEMINSNEEYKYISWNLYRDVSVFGNVLYLLFWSKEEFPQYYPHIRQRIYEVFVLNDDGTSLAPKCIFNLQTMGESVEKRMFKGIAVYEKYLFAFDGRSQSLLRYAIP